MTEESQPLTRVGKSGDSVLADTFVINQTLALSINICGENRHLRQARKRSGNRNAPIEVPANLKLLTLNI